MAKYVSMTERDLREPVGISGQRWRQNLDRHLARESLVPRPIHFAHTAGADRLNDHVSSQTGVRRQCHVGTQVLDKFEALRRALSS